MAVGPTGILPVDSILLTGQDAGLLHRLEACATARYAFRYLLSAAPYSLSQVVSAVHVQNVTRNIRGHR